MSTHAYISTHLPIEHWRSFKQLKLFWSEITLTQHWRSFKQLKLFWSEIEWSCVRRRQDFCQSTIKTS